MVALQAALEGHQIHQGLVLLEHDGGKDEGYGMASKTEIDGLVPFARV